MLGLVICQMLVLVPLTGTWRMEAPSQKAFHLVVGLQEGIRLYEADWAPFDVHERKMGGPGQFALRFSRFGYNSNRTLQLSAQGDRLSGTIEQLAGGGQFPIKRPVRFERTMRHVPGDPFEWIERTRGGGDRIDLIGHLLDNAPLESFEAFQRFWSESFEPRFYLYLEPYIYGVRGQAEPRSAAMRRVYLSLQAYAQPPDGRLEESVVSAAQRTGTHAVRSAIGDAACRVILPPIAEDSRLRVLKLATAKEGEACCGSRGLKLENFLLIPVPAVAQASGGR